MPRAILTRRFPPALVEQLTAAGIDITRHNGDEPMPRAGRLEFVCGADAIVTTINDRVDDGLLDAAGDSLKLVANFGVGYDNIDLDACRARGVLVSNTPGVLTDATADLAWTLILMAARRAVEGERMVRGGEWRGWAPTQLVGVDVTGATLGVVGAGRIGCAVARRAAGFHMTVLYAHPRNQPELDRIGAQHVDIDQLVAEADIISLHVPMRPETHHLISRERIAQMKRTAILINTARGPVVDEAALVDALRERRIFAAGLDVYENEPRLAPGLVELHNVALLPHLGSATEGTRTKMAEMVAANVIAALSGKPPLNPVTA
ncbi:MAG: D-glycerate dehydrogenase [Phycisphaerales bacterium]|nr:D-glycerate dehydrogenase [Phycisphaerales bacterium]